MCPCSTAAVQKIASPKGLTKLSEEVYADKKHIVKQRLEEKQDAILAADLPVFFENGIAMILCQHRKGEIYENDKS